MPQINFNDPYINTELLPSFSGSLEKIQKMIDKLNGYFQEAMILFQFERQKLFREKRELVNLKAHRVFILCVMCHDKTMEISSANEGAEIDLNIRPTGEKKLLCKNYFIENYNTGNILVLGIHHADDLTIGYTDDTLTSYSPVGDEEFQNRGRELIQNILRIGFLEFLTKKRNYLSSDKTKELLLRNIPRMNEKDQENIAKIVEKNMQSRTEGATPL